jgi:hypothetical protein
MKVICHLVTLSVLSCALVQFVDGSRAEEPCVSGLPKGQRPKPYSFLVATGPERGQSTCYICETADRPAVVIFARNLGDPLGKLVAKLDKALSDHKKEELRAWVTFLSDDQPTMDPKVVKWGKKHAIRGVPLGVFEEAGGPPAYRLARDADVTILFFVKRKIVANFAFRAGELTDERASDVLKALPSIVGEKK